MRKRHAGGMELRHLRYFVAVAEEENVTRAALRLHVSQPALSRQVRDLEDELGFPLLLRTAKSVSLTDAGRALLGEARAVLQRADEAVKAARGVAVGGGELHVGYAPSPTVRLLPPTLRAFQAELPRVRVKLHDLSTEEMIAGLREGRLQLAVLVKPLKAMLRGLHFETLERDALRLAVPPGHPWARQRSVPLAQAAKARFVGLTRSEYPEYYATFDELFATVRPQPRVVEEHEGATSLIAAVEAGGGVALVSQSLACTAGARLKLLPLTPAPAPLIVGAAWSGDLVPPAVDLFLKCARAAVTGGRG
ncbi:MAG: LysR substrate-binding domain-containing protein [Opitutaceae bacterium]